MVKTRTWIVLIAAAAVVLAAVSLVLLTSRKAGTVVQVIQDGTVVREIDLSRVTQEYSFELESESGGHNTVLVQPGRICVSEADCPDQICVQQGWLTNQALPIVCMPHGLIITVTDPAGQDVDAVSR